jgi:hypothetical protein
MDKFPGFICLKLMAIDSFFSGTNMNYTKKVEGNIMPIQIFGIKNLIIVLFSNNFNIFNF